MIILEDMTGDAGYLSFENEEGARLYEELDAALETAGAYPPGTTLSRVTDVNLPDAVPVPAALVARIAAALVIDEDTDEYSEDEAALWVLLEETNEYWYVVENKGTPILSG